MINIDKFFVFENENNMFDFKLREIYIWQLVRGFVYNNIIQTLNNSGDIHPFMKTTKYKKIKLLCKRVVLGISKNPYNINTDVDLVVFNHPRRVLMNGLYKCTYTDDILKQLNYKSVVLEKNYNGMHFNPVSTENLYYTDLIDIKRLVVKFINRRILKRGLSDNEIMEINEVLRKLENTFKIKLNIKKIIIYIENIVLDYIFLKKEYKKLLKKINPKLVIEVVHYNIMTYSINSACKELGIKTVELQHGIITNKNIHYNYPLCAKHISTFPNYIFTFGKLYNTIARYPIKNNKVINVGFLNIDQIDKSNNIRNENTIVFLSQGPIGKELSQFAVELQDMIDDKYKIIYKLHPSEYDTWRKLYPWLINSKIKIVDESCDVYEIFKCSFAQVGVYSTALVEGIAFNLKTYILNNKYKEYIDFIYNSGLAKVVDTPQEIIKDLENKSTLESSELVWKEDALKNIKASIKQVIAEV